MILTLIFLVYNFNQNNMEKKPPFPLNLRMKLQEGQNAPSLTVFLWVGLWLFPVISVQDCDHMNLASQSSGKMFNLQSLSKIFFYIIFVFLKSTQLQGRVGKEFMRLNILI